MIERKGITIPPVLSQIAFSVLRHTKLTIKYGNLFRIVLKIMPISAILYSYNYGGEVYPFEDPHRPDVQNLPFRS